MQGPVLGEASCNVQGGPHHGSPHPAQSINYDEVEETLPCDHATIISCLDKLKGLPTRLPGTLLLLQSSSQPEAKAF